MHINHDLYQTELIDLDIPLTTNCACFKIEDCFIHFKGYLFDNDNTHYTFNKWYNKPDSYISISTKYSNYKVLSLVQWCNNFFQHITFDTLTKLKMINELLNNEPDLFILVNNALQRDLLIRFGHLKISLDKFIIQEPGRICYKVGIGYYISFYNKDGFQTLLGCSGFGTISNFVHKSITKPKYVVYISRKGLDKRFIDHDKEVEIIDSLKNYANKHNYTFKMFNNPSLTDEIQHVLNESRMLVTVHGGALGNIIWCNSQTTVVEIIPKEKLKIRPCFHFLAKSLGLEYYFFEPDTFDFDKNVPIDVDVDKLNCFLNNIDVR